MSTAIGWMLRSIPYKLAGCLIVGGISIATLFIRHEPQKVVSLEDLKVEAARKKACLRAMEEETRRALETL